MFNIMGTLADKANLPWEFRIEENIETTLMRIKKGNIILAEKINMANLLWSWIKPGASKAKIEGIKISIIITINVVADIKMTIELPTNSLASLLFFSPNNFEYIGTKAELNAPSENILLNVFGNLKAT